MTQNFSDPWSEWLLYRRHGGDAKLEQSVLADTMKYADRVLDGTADQQTLGGLDVTVRRNAFGRQVDSFESDLRIEGIDGEPVHAVFIRAPWVEEVGPAARVLGRVEGGHAAGRIVAVRQGPLLVTSFHPEVTGDTRVHRLFVEMVRGDR